jgi:hypothetical protein
MLDGFVVEVAVMAAKHLRSYAGLRPFLIIMDLVPVVDGWRFAARLAYERRHSLHRLFGVAILAKPRSIFTLPLHKPTDMTRPRWCLGDAWTAQ